MIEGNKDAGYTLTCDYCEDDFDGFETFIEAVNYKKDYGWKSVKGRKSGDWHELCPDCAEDQEVFDKFKEM